MSVSNYVRPYVISDTNTAVLTFQSYSHNFGSFSAVYDNFYAGESSTDIVNTSQFPDVLTNESNINPTVFNNIFEGDLIPSFQQGNQRYFPPITDFKFYTDALVPAFSVSTFNSFACGSSTKLNISICQRNASIEHMVVYRKNGTFTPDPSVLDWTVLTPIVNEASYPGLRTGSAQGTNFTYQFDIDFNTGSGDYPGYTFAIIPFGHQLISGLAAVSSTDLGGGVRMIADSNDPFGIGMINITSPVIIPFFSNNTDICQGYGEKLNGLFRVNYQPNSTHMLMACYTRDILGDSCLGAAFLFCEDLEAGGNSGFSSGYSDFDFNDLTLFIYPQVNDDEGIALTLYNT